MLAGCDGSTDPVCTPPVSDLERGVEDPVKSTFHCSNMDFLSMLETAYR